METILKFRKPVATALITVMTLASVPVSTANAAIVGTDKVIEQSQSSSRDRVAAFLQREDVRAQLQAYDVSPEEAEARVAALSDEEVQMIAGRIDELPAGQGTVGVIVGSIVLIFVVLLITDLIGLTHVFGFTNKGSLNPN